MTLTIDCLWNVTDVIVSQLWPDWGNEGKLFGRLDEGGDPVSRLATVVHWSLHTCITKHCNDDKLDKGTDAWVPQHPVPQYQGTTVPQYLGTRVLEYPSTRIQGTRVPGSRVPEEETGAYLRKEPQGDDCEAPASVAARRTSCCEAATTPTGRQSPCLRWRSLIDNLNTQW